MRAIVIAQETTSGGGGAAGLIILLALLVMFILMFAGMWATYAKAGEAGWAALIPIYKRVVLLRIIGKPTWWVVLFLIPPVNVVVALIAAVNLAKAFGKGTGFGVGLVFLPTAFYPALGFGDAQYRGVAWSAAPTAAATA